MIFMDQRPLQDFPTPTDENPPSPGLFRRIYNQLARFGLGETALRIGTHMLILLLVVGVVFLMQYLYRSTVQADS